MDKGEVGRRVPYLVKSGKAAPNRDRRTAFAARTEAAKMT